MSSRASRATFLLPIPNLKQSHTSANCGPCSLKMVLDYYEVMHPKHNTPYSLHACNRLLKTSTAYGVEEADFETVLRRLELGYKRIELTEIELELKSHRPIISLYEDEDHEGHYSLIIGFNESELVFNDPWDPGRITRPRTKFPQMAASYGNWLISVTGPQ